jgi:hypothetical protein
VRRDLAAQGCTAGRWHHSIERGCVWQLWGQRRLCPAKVLLLLLVVVVVLWLQAGLVLQAKRAQHLWLRGHGWHHLLLLLLCCRCIFA